MDEYFYEYFSSIDDEEQKKIFYYLENNNTFSLYIRYIYLNNIIDIIEKNILNIINQNYGEEQLRYYAQKREFNKIQKNLKELVNHSVTLIKIEIFYSEFKITKLAFNKRYHSDILLKSLEYNIFDNIYDLYKHINNKEKNIENFYKNYIPELINKRNIDNELKKILFIIYFKDIFNALDDTFDKLNIMVGLIKIFILDCDTSKYSLYLGKYTNYNLEYINKLFQLKDYDNFFQKIQKSKSNLVEVNDTFFKYSKILIEKNINALHYSIQPPLSSGQKAILFIFARIDDAIKRINHESKYQNILILLDEADLKLHLEWQRKLINDLIEFLNKYSSKKIYILYATHSPMILSDITDSRVVFLKKEGEYSDDIYMNNKNKKRTFGANIYDLYHDSFFMDQFMGEFAQNKINEIIDIINLYKIIEEFEKIQNNNKKIMKYIKPFINRYNLYKIINNYNKRYSIENNIVQSNWKKNLFNIIRQVYKDREYLQSIKSNIIDDKDILYNTIESIGEPILRNQLLDEVKYIGVTDKTQDIVNKLKDLSHDDIEKELNQYDREKQIEIWKLLFKIKDSN